MLLLLLLPLLRRAKARSLRLNAIICPGLWGGIGGLVYTVYCRSFHARQTTERCSPLDRRRVDAHSNETNTDQFCCGNDGTSGDRTSISPRSCRWSAEGEPVRAVALMKRLQAHGFEPSLYTYETIVWGFAQVRRNRKYG